MRLRALVRQLMPIWLVPVFTAMLVTVAPSIAEKPASTEARSETGQPAALERERQAEVARMAPLKARLLEVLVGEDSPVQAALCTEPLLRWSNPTAGSVYGEVFLWHVEGRPAAVASIFRWYHPYKGATLEIVSLSPSPVLAREGDEVDWDCRSAGVAFRAADIETPAASRRGRLGQMRDFARRFAAELTDERGGEKVVRELRLLNQPAYRYECRRQQVIDGALFAFAEATDPEAWLMVEAAGEGTAVSWRYALIRMNNHELHVRLDDSVVQSWPRIHDPWKDRKSSYTLFSFEPPAADKTPPPKKP